MQRGCVISIDRSIKLKGSLQKQNVTFVSKSFSTNSLNLQFFCFYLLMIKYPRVWFNGAVVVAWLVAVDCYKCWRFLPDEADFNAARSENFPAKNVLSGTARWQPGATPRPRQPIRGQESSLWPIRGVIKAAPDTAVCSALYVTRKNKGFLTLSTKYFFNDMQFEAMIARVEMASTGSVFLSLKSNNIYNST